MWHLLKSLSVFVVVLVMVGCATPQRSVEMHDMEHSLWSESEDFYYDNTDTLARREISVVVRYGMGYVADSVATVPNYPKDMESLNETLAAIRAKEAK